MKALISTVLVLMAASASAQYQRQTFEAPSGTQGRPISIEIETIGEVVSMRAEQMEVTAGYTCPDGYVQPGEQSVINPGTIGGAVVGGLAAHQVGGGRGKTAATIAGTVAGGMVGNEIYKRMNDADDERARRAPGRPGECYEVKQMVPVYVYRIMIRGLNLQGGDKPVRIEQTNVRAFTKYAIGQQVPAKIQINYFVNRLD